MVGDTPSIRLGKLRDSEDPNEVFPYGINLIFDINFRKEEIKLPG